MNRFRQAALALVCLVATGCVEGEVAYTVNPDGSAKIKFDVVTVKPYQAGPGGPLPGVKKEEDKDLDDLVRDAIGPILQTPGIAAWKDVSAEYLPNGKLKMSGTAYVRRLQDFKLLSPALLNPHFSAERGADGTFKLVPKKDDPQPGSAQRKKKTPEEIKKMSDAELDKYIVRELIDIQAVRPMLGTLLGRVKLKITYLLPGEPADAKGFVRDGRKLMFTMEGEKILSLLDTLLERDTAAWRKAYRSDGAFALDHLGPEGFGAPGAPITVAKPEVVFDFDKEVKAAREAYPALRKKFGFSDDLWLPTTDGPPPKK